MQKVNFAYVLRYIVSTFKVSSDSDKYLPRHSIITDCLLSDFINFD